MTSHMVKKSKVSGPIPTTDHVSVTSPCPMDTANPPIVPLAPPLSLPPFIPFSSVSGVWPKCATLGLVQSVESGQAFRLARASSLVLCLCRIQSSTQCGCDLKKDLKIQGYTPIASQVYWYILPSPVIALPSPPPPSPSFLFVFLCGVGGQVAFRRKRTRW